ncbi:MAG: response regulator [Ignavibacteria bacterium]|nr:response regulator [Ignavibacteria bacterium]
MEHPTINILIVEDNLAHQKITEYILKKNNIPARLFVVHDGQEVLDYLYRKNEYADISNHPLPNLILLDLNLPKRDGREVLKVIKHDASLKEIPVVILSTSDREEDMHYAFSNGAVAYISKASGFDKFNEDLASVTKYARI